LPHPALHVDPHADANVTQLAAIVMAGAGPAGDGQRDVCFTGWLGLLRALYLVTGSG
jgi:hypothetical protein